MPLTDVEIIKQNYNLVDFVLQHQGLRIDRVEKTGNGIKICSPFRNEKTPSFHVTPEYFKDFGNAKCKGDIFTFVQMLLGCDFKGAIEYLTGEEQTAKAKPRPAVAAAPKPLPFSLTDVLKWEENLHHVMPYLASRGITTKAAQYMKVGAELVNKKYITLNGTTHWLKCWRIVMPYTFGNRLLSVKFRRDDTSAITALKAEFPKVKDPIEYLKLDLSGKNNDADPDSFTEEDVLYAVFGLKFKKRGPASVYNADMLCHETPDGWVYPKHTAMIASPEGKEIDVLSLLSAGFPSVGINPGTKTSIRRVFQNVRIAMIPRDNEKDQKNKLTGDWVNPGLEYGQDLHEVLGSLQYRASFIDPPDGFKDLNDLAKVGKLTEFLTRKPYHLEPCPNLL